MDIFSRLADELMVERKQVAAAVGLLDDGDTVPFISRYRKEVTGGLTDTHLRQLDERLTYLRELDKRRVLVLETISEQGKLTPALEKLIRETDSKTRLEDLYLPYKPKRRTKAQIARERGLQPLADQLLAQQDLDAEAAAAGYVDDEKELADVTAVLDGARQILMEQFAENADLVMRLRQLVWDEGVMASQVAKGKEEEGAKFKDYFDYREALHKMPSHRVLALFRGRNEGVLNLKLQVSEEEAVGQSRCENEVAKQFKIDPEIASPWLWKTVQWSWKIKIFSRIDVDMKLKLKEQAEAEAIKVFANNLNDLLLAAPAGPKTVLGLDPGLRTGVKVALVNATGKVLDTDTIYPHAPQKKWNTALASLARLAKMHQVSLISIGNGTASRETEKLARELCEALPELNMTPIVVSEAGASVYSASELASNELPDMDVSLRGAVSIARRLQDPLAELVKIEPKAIGVGQYQHDVNQVQLNRGLQAVVEDCVNAVGVDVNTASPALLTQVAGLSRDMAKNIVLYRDQNGAYQERKQLLNVSRLGPKAYEQAAGFLRIVKGKNPLDASAVHPEAYPLVEKILQKSGRKIEQILGESAFLNSLNVNDYRDETFGAPTVVDIFKELEKPGRDPRPEFKTATFKEGVETMKDLVEDMRLEGVVTNVTNFGAFVDVGVHQDGLVHISQLADRFVKDPRDVVKAGDIVNVRVVAVDIKRQRIALSMKLNEK
ncbi:MAG: Tex family protein, partial [Gammaproteobacteria bacterium]|nr:Tex family protein [Gammaproteobacteria bacterium]